VPCYSLAVNERVFIDKIHGLLSKKIYRWKIHDQYHGGVPDTYYSGPAGLCFVEYKYKPHFPVKDTSLVNFQLSKQQEEWLIQQREYNVPVFVAAGCEDKCVFTDRFEKVNGMTKKEFLTQAMAFGNLVRSLEELCLETIEYTKIKKDYFP